MQMYTQHAGVRPFGISMIFGGVDKLGPKVLQADPSGACWGYKAVAIGAGSDTVRELLEAKYSDSATLEESTMLAVESLSKVVEGKLDSQKVRLVVIPADTKKFTKLNPEEVAKYVAKAVPQ